MNKINRLLKDIGIDPVKLYLNAESSKRDILNDNKGLAGIYKWTNIETGDSYVGSGVDLAKRIRSYYQMAELEKHPRHINNALLKYGHDKFKLEILEYCDRDKLMEREQFYLDEINPTYNILKKAYSLEGFKHSAETIEALKAREFTEEHRENLSKASAWREGRVPSEYTLKKLSESLKKYHKEHPNKHPLTPEALENIKQKTTEREAVPVTLVNKDTGEEIPFATQTDAGTFLGITRQAIKKALDRGSIMAKVFKVKRTDEQNKDVGTKYTTSKDKKGGGNDDNFPGNPPYFSDDGD